MDTMPFAIMVFTTGMCSLFTNSVNAPDACCRTAPLPASITGTFACLISSLAATTAFLEAYSTSFSCFFKGATSAGILVMFFGKSICVAPGFSFSAYLNASRVISATVSGRIICLVRLVMGANMVVKSRYWWLVNCIWSVPT